MRPVVALAVALALLAAGSASAATPKGLAGYGYHLYGGYCAGCHGPNAAGRLGGSSGFGPGRQQEPQTAIGPSLRGVGPLAADFYLRMRYMPLVRVGPQPEPRNRAIFSDHQIRALVAYIASFGGPAIPRPHPQRGSLSQGLAQFTEHCAGCHQVVGQGGYVTGALPPPLSQATTATEIAEAVRIGPYVMPKFTQKAISNRELDSIVRYVEYSTHPASPGGASIGNLGPVPEGLVTWFVAMPLILILCMLIGKRYRST
jgi:ubiquinol-cytochrome c reductase cytochrome c subunit